MKDAKNAQWISVFEHVLKLLRCSEPNAFGYCGVFGLSEAIRIRQEKTIALVIHSVDPSLFAQLIVGLRSVHRILDVVRLLYRNVKLYIIW